MPEHCCKNRCTPAALHFLHKSAIARLSIAANTNIVHSRFALYVKSAAAHLSTAAKTNIARSSPIHKIRGSSPEHCPQKTAIYQPRFILKIHCSSPKHCPQKPHSSVGFNCPSEYRIKRTDLTQLAYSAAPPGNTGRVGILLMLLLPQTHQIH